MKKLLISILMGLLLILTFLTIFRGLAFAGIEIPGISQIQAKSEELDAGISEATILASTEYENALKNIESDIKKLEEEKKNYNDLVTISTGDQVQSANQYQKYEIEYLWTIIGNHATSEGVVLKMDLLSGIGENHYNLNFTVTGSYIGIIDFISDIENDTVLGFKIENFALNPGSSTSDLKATFTCKDVVITDISKGNAVPQTNTTNSNTTNVNTTNTTNSNATNTSTTNTANNNTANNNTTNTNTTNTTNSNTTSTNTAN